ncbi:MAG: prepilin-type N-terminal cleavage/methylation domain-containing protein [Patescibacteria group bacterium]
MKVSSKKYKRGFTLIELLVVISIISLLSSIIMSSLQSARSKARDTQRIQTLRQMVTALRLYADTTGHFPNSGAAWYADCWQGTNWIPDSGVYTWSNGYIGTQSHDPVDVCDWPWSTAPGAGTYAYWSDGVMYALVAKLENSSRYDIQNSNTKWVDGNTLYSFYGWGGRAYAVVNK